MKKVILYCTVISLLCSFMLTGCITAEPPENNNDDSIVLATKEPEGENSVGESNSAESATAAPTEAPTEEPTPVPAAEPTAVPENFPVEGEYIDVSAIKRVYFNPGESRNVEFDVIGTTYGWTSSDSSVISVERKDGQLIATAHKTGYSKFINEITGDTVQAYCIEAAEQTDENKVIEGINYFLYYEKGSHTLTVYKADSDGYYTVPIKTISCACGSVSSKTPVGVHALKGDYDYNRLRWITFSQNCRAQYGICYSYGVFLHSTCYSDTRENSVLSHYYNSIGKSSTGGCLRMQAGEMLWIWENCPEGTLLKIVDGSPRGTYSELPAEISDSAMYDPTDPAYYEYLKSNGFVS